MNNFCRCLGESLHCEFNIDACIFVSKKKKLVHFSFPNSLISYHFDELVRFVRMYWNKRKYFYPGYFLMEPRLNQCVKFKFEYSLIVKRKCLKSSAAFKVY